MSPQIPASSVQRSLLNLLFGVGLVVLSLTVLGGLLASARLPQWPSVAILAALTLAMAAMRFRVPGQERPISMAPFGVLATAVSQPLWVVAMLAIPAVFFSRFRSRPASGESAINADGESGSPPLHEVAIAPLSAAASGAVLSLLVGPAQLPVLAAILVSAVVYFAVAEAVPAVYDSINGRPEVLECWRERLNAWLPLVVTAPLGVLFAEMILGGNGPFGRVAGAVLLIALWGGLRAYFPRLHNRRQHADRMADVRQQALETLAVAIEAKDGSTAGHLQRVRLHASRLAKRLGCGEEEVRTIRLAAVLHDVGKVGVPDYILMKPSRLSQQEFDTITRHAQIGADIVASMRFPEPVEEVVLAHHEHWDGSGYPHGLREDEIPRLARILTVVDCFDALVSERPYRRALPVEDAIRLMRKQRGKIFDPQICDAFFAQLPEHLDELQEQLEAERVRLLDEGIFTAGIKQTWVDRDVESTEGEKQATLQKLTQAPERLLAFYEILQTLGADLDFERGFTEALATLKQVCPFDRGGLFLLEEDHYVLTATNGLPDHCLTRLSYPRETEPFQVAADSGVPIISDLAPQGADDGALALYMADVKSSLVAPLTFEGRHLGALLLTADEAGAMTEEHGLFVSLITDKLAQTVVSSQKLRKLTFDARTDKTTGLPNARASFSKLEQELLRAEREGQTVGVLFMDINGLKPINDCYGHAAGDKLLSDTGRKLVESLRSYDFVGRVGGDEFLAILPGATPIGLEERVQVLKKHVSAAPIEVVHGVNARAMISVGAALYPRDGLTADDLVYSSDRRMYEDKEAGRADLFTLPPGTSYVSDPSSASTGD